MPIHVSRAALLLTVGLCCTIALPAAALADASDARFDAMEKQIEGLQAELRHMKAARAQDREQDRAQDRAQHARAETALAARAGHVQANADRAAVSTVMPNIPPGYALVAATPGQAPGSVSLAEIEPPPPQKLPLQSPLGTFKIGDVSFTFGGYLEAAGIYRSRNEVADLASNFNTGIPLPNSPNYHQSEFRMSARQSRVTGLVQAKVDPQTKLSAYLELDFLGAAPTANSVETNSYNPRMRQGFVEYDRTDWGVQVVAGQAWSLLTLDKKGIVARQENTPLTIDAQNVVGFTWARQPQIRVVKSFNDQSIWVAASLENPQASFYTGPNGLAPSSAGTINITNPGGTGYASTNTYSTDVAPDVVAKVATDWGPAHLEAFGVMRLLHDRVSFVGSGGNNTTLAGGVGAGMVVHVIPKYLDLQGSFLVGDGIGRYGAAQLPDAVVGRDGAPVALPEVQALVGVVGHPNPAFDLYAYAGTEQTSRRSFDVGKTGYGYGSALYANSTCGIELGAASGCVGNTSGVSQGTLGGWWKFIHGPYGTMQTGLQYSYTDRSIFKGVGPTPKTNDNMVMLSLRYYPFQ